MPLPSPRQLCSLLVLSAAGWPAPGCGDDPVDDDGVVLLERPDQLLRASMALRGIRPSVAELREIRDDPSAYDRIVDRYLHSHEFTATIRDLHAELYLLRTDTEVQLPVRGLLEELGYTQGEIYASTVEAPLNLVADIVANDRPYTEILTATQTLADPLVAHIYGLDYDPAGPLLQHTPWVDGRPPAGILSDSQILRRHVSNAANFNRARGNFVSHTFLCEDIGARDVLVEGGIDISDPAVVAEAVYSEPNCVGCHAALDPLAGFFWGYMQKLGGGAVTVAYNEGCVGDFFPGDPLRGSYERQRYCYPLEFYRASESRLWQSFDLRPPAYFGAAGETLTDLGRLVADDPRFSSCTARTFFGWLAETERDAVPQEVTAELQQTFVDSGYSARELARAVVTSPSFLALRSEPGRDAFVAGPQTLRPEQTARAIEDLTGFRWLSNQDPDGCAAPADECWGTVELTTSDLFGFRSMSGGVDGVAVTHPTHTATPTKALALARLADEAAGFVVDSDLAAPDDERHLLAGVEAGTTDEDLVRAKLEWLHLRILAEFVVADGPEVDATFALWSGVHGRTGSTEHAWKVVIAAMLQDVRMVYY